MKYKHNWVTRLYFKIWCKFNKKKLNTRHLFDYDILSPFEKEMVQDFITRYKYYWNPRERGGHK